VPVYLADLEFSGRFEKPDFEGWIDDPEDVLWDRAELVVSVRDPRGIRNAATLEWGQQAFDFLPGANIVIPNAHADPSGFHVELREAALAANEGVDFAFRLVLQGNATLRVAPFAKQTKMQLRSNWPDPGFRGGWLPLERTVDASGFEATWAIPFLGRSFPQRWNDPESVQPGIENSLFGVDLVTMVDEYRMAHRSAKYGMLFISLTFGTLWLFEVIGGIRVHSIQYLLVGAGLCLFYLLEVSLSEHLGFALAYVLASTAVIALVTAYSRAVIGDARRVAGLAAVLIALYGYLFFLLRDQDEALLVGSLGLFGTLALVMYLTRKVDWSVLTPDSVSSPQQPESDRDDDSGPPALRTRF
jgi:inner membrane protein